MGVVRRKRFLTEYFIKGQKYGSSLLAYSWKEAQRLCDVGHKVIGIKCRNYA